MYNKIVFPVFDCVLLAFFLSKERFFTAHREASSASHRDLRVTILCNWCSSFVLKQFEIWGSVGPPPKRGCAQNLHGR